MIDGPVPKGFKYTSRVSTSQHHLVNSGSSVGGKELVQLGRLEV